MNWKISVLSVFFLSSVACSLHAADNVPHVEGMQIQAVAHPYAEPEAATAAVEHAFEIARQTGRRVLIDYGANWCPDCRILAGVLESPEVKPWVEKNFVLAKVNVDRFNQNLDLAKKYGIQIKQIPVLLVVTPDGKVLNPEATLELGSARSMTAQEIVDRLALWNSRS